MDPTPAPGFPNLRLRRLRQHPRLRDLVRENRLTLDDLVYPLFVYHGRDLRREIPSMPGQYQYSLDRLAEAVDEVVGIEDPRRAPLRHPRAQGRPRLGRLRGRGIVQEAIRLFKKRSPETCW